MKNILMLFFAIAISHASAADICDEPLQQAPPKNFLIIRENFSLCPLHPKSANAFAEALAPTFADAKTMRYVGVGKIYDLLEVKALFSRLACRMYSEIKLTTYSWVLVMNNEPRGLVQALLKEEGMYEAVLILSPSVQGKRLAQEIAYAVFKFLPNVSWIATADPKNLASISAMKKEGFEYKETRYFKEYNSERHVFVRSPRNAAALSSKL